MFRRKNIGSMLVFGLAAYFAYSQYKKKKLQAAIAASINNNSTSSVASH